MTRCVRLSRSVLAPVALFSVPLMVLLAGCGGDDVTVSDSAYNRLATRLSQPEVVAGTAVGVQCVKITGDKEEIVTDAKFTADPAEGVSGAGFEIIPSRAGDLEVTCSYGDNSGIALEPATVKVLPGPIVATRVTFDPPESPAGVHALAKCEAIDSFGNASTSEAQHFTLSATGENTETITISGLHAYGIKVGAYNFVCDFLVQEDEAQYPGSLVIVPGPAAELKLTLDPDEQAYAPGAQLRLVPAAKDSYGNVIEHPDLDVTITPAGGGLNLSPGTLVLKAVNEGVYELAAHVAGRPQVQDKIRIVVDGSVPQINLATPKQALRHKGQPVIGVTGYATDNSGPLAELTVNGSKITIAEDGSFAVQVDLEPGINTIIVEATDQNGLKTRAVRWVLWSPEYLPLTKGASDIERVEAGTLVRLGQESIDDGDHDHKNPDDIATLLEVALEDLDIEDALDPKWVIYEDPGLGMKASFELDTVKSKDPVVAMALDRGHLRFGVAFWDVEISGDAVLSTEAIGLPVEVKAGIGTITADNAQLKARLIPSIDEDSGEVVWEILAAEVMLENMVVDMSDIFDGLGIDIESLLQNELKTVIEVFLAGELEKQLPVALEGVFAAWKVDQTFEVPALFGEGNPMEIRVEGGLTDIKADLDALTLSLDTTVRDKALQLSDPIGSVGDLGCATDLKPSSAPLHFGVTDPVLNRFVHLVWAGEMLDLQATAPDPKSMEAFCGFGSITELLNADNSEITVQVMPLLPPVLNSCQADSAKKELYDLQLGAMRIDLTYKRTGQPVQLSLEIGFNAPVTQAEPDPEAEALLAMAVGTPVDVHVEVVQGQGVGKTERDEFAASLGEEGMAMLAEGITGCISGLLSFEAFDAAALIPEAEGMTLEPVFETLEHESGTLWFGGKLD